MWSRLTGAQNQAYCQEIAESIEVLADADRRSRRPGELHVLLLADRHGEHRSYTGVILAVVLLHVTGMLQETVKEADVKEGICYLYVPHTTAGITINEGADPSVQRDIQNTLNKLAPQDINYFHREGNADAHIKSTLVGTSIHVIVDGGKLLLGTWQSIFFCEFDGPETGRSMLR